MAPSGIHSPVRLCRPREYTVVRLAKRFRPSCLSSDVQRVNVPLRRVCLNLIEHARQGIGCEGKHNLARELRPPSRRGLHGSTTEHLENLVFQKFAPYESITCNAISVETLGFSRCPVVVGPLYQLRSLRTVMSVCSIRARSRYSGGFDERLICK